MSSGADGGGGRTPAHLLYAVAVEYYEQSATQAEIASRLQTSRATVSRMLAEARRCGIVHIDVRQPGAASDTGLSRALADALGLVEAHLYRDVPADAAGGVLSSALSGPLGSALASADLGAGDVLLVSSGKMAYAASRARLPRLPGVVVAPTVGGQSEREPWYQTNEVVRAFAAGVGGDPAFLHAPALPGEALREGLLEDAGIRRVLDTWEVARAAVLGVGAPPALRISLPRYVPAQSTALDRAVGDVCSRFYDRQGRPVDFPGSERLIATPLEQLRRIPVTVAVASGAEKVVSLLAAARAGYFNRLATDETTARLLLAAVA